VQLLDDVFRGDTDGRDEQLGTGLDDDVDQLIELALGVVIAARSMWSAEGPPRRHRIIDLLGFPRIATNLGQQEIDAKRRILVVEVRLELLDLIPEHLGGVVDAAQNTKTAGVCDGRGQLGASGDVHAGEEDGVVDLEEIGDLGADLLCKRTSSRQRCMFVACASRARMTSLG
jgi:hypothetical protein